MRVSIGHQLKVCDKTGYKAVEAKSVWKSGTSLRSPTLDSRDLC